MVVRLRNLQVDVGPRAHEAALAWWATALGGSPRAADGPYTHLDGVRGRVGVHVQRLGGEVEGRYHLDVETDDIAAEVARLVDAGATDQGPTSGSQDGTRLLTDPAGLPFCVTAPGQIQHLSDDRDEGVHLRVLMLDVPADVAGVESRFWATALGAEVRPVGDHYPDYTWIRPAEGPGGPTNLCVQTTHGDDARMHVDLHCPDATARDQQVESLTALGADVVRRTDHWVVLRAPGGHLACIVPDPA